MPEEKYKSGGTTYTIAVNPAPADGKKYPIVMVLHGNFGLKEPYGHQILSFAEDLAKIGYVTAVPRYYEKDPLEPVDIAMTYLARKKPTNVMALVDFFGRTKDNKDIQGGAPGFPPTIIFQDTDDQVVKAIESRNLKAWLPNTPNYEIHEYTDPGSAPLHHGFEEGQAADLDSRKRAAEWLKKHLPPTGT
jgi:dienelactone hydrolase